METKSIMTTMKRVRDFPPWADDLDTPDDTPVVVHADGSVNVAATGDRITDPLDHHVWLAEWQRYWAESARTAA